MEISLSRFKGEGPLLLGQKNILKAARLDTQLGAMLAIADDNRLFMLDFEDSSRLDHDVALLKRWTQSAILSGSTPIIMDIGEELEKYFDGCLKEFKTPISFPGTPFQMRVWELLLSIPYGETRTYSDLARSVGIPMSYRAVGSANGANRLAIVVPCHRVTNIKGGLAGYGGGISRKKWLIDHENKHPQVSL